jgi:hypothetical protein
MIEEPRAFQRIGSVTFPRPRGIDINMMPLVLGDRSTWTDGCLAYEDILALCAFPQDEVCYLSIHEAELRVGETLRRPGIHTEATPFGAWGGGGLGRGPRGREPWDGKTGIYQASTDGRCRIWDVMTDAVSLGGSVVRKPEGDGFVMEPGMLFWMTDRTPHESLPVEVAGWRQWFRLVSPNIAIWWAQHSTQNPTGLQVPASVQVMPGDKFAVDPVHFR